MKLMEKADRWALHPTAALGVSGTRAIIGFVGLMFYVSQYAERSYLFGPGEDTLLPHHLFVEEIERAGIASVYAWSSSPLVFELIFHVGLAAAFAVMLGIGGRPVLALHGLLLWSLYQRQPALMDGGDNLTHIIIPFLLLTRCYEHFALRSPLGERLLRRLPTAARSVGVPLHNLGVAAIAAQICLVYVVSGLYKVQGQTWMDGTALFYVMRVPEFELPGVSHLVYGSDALVYLGTYATVLFLVYFPLGVLVPALRPWAAAMSICFHLGIAGLMGLTSFALTMIACDLVFLSPEIARAMAWLRSTSQHITARRTKTPEHNRLPEPARPPATASIE